MGDIMGNLKKPEKCKCGSTNIHKECHPERWVCSTCDAVIVSRGKKPQTGICTNCGVKKSSNVSFKPGKNLCMKCYREYMNVWYQENHERQKQRKREYYNKNKKEIRKKMNEFNQSSVETFMAELIHRCQALSKRKIGGGDRKIEMNITKDYLLSLYNSQNGKCAITKMKMDHRYGLATSMSVDRIDSGAGYVESNVQLVCKVVNLAKNASTNQEIVEFFDQYYSERKSKESVCG